MNKTIICHGKVNDSLYGTGDNPRLAYEDYTDNAGEDSIDDCAFYEADEVEIEFVIKRKETVGSAAKK